MFLAVVLFAVAIPNVFAAEPQNNVEISVESVEPEGLVEKEAFEELPLTLAAAYDVSYLTLAPGADATQLTFSWHTASRTSAPVVSIWKSGEEAMEFTGTSSASTSSISTMYYNDVTATGLKADAVYLYQVGDGSGNWSDEYSTKTGNPTAFSYIVVGDPQIGSSNATTDTNAWVNTMNRIQQYFQNIAFLAGTGDEIETSRNLSHYTGFFPRLR